MSISNESELIGMKEVSEVVGTTLKLMIEYAKVGMSTKELDEYGGELLKSYGAKSLVMKIHYKFQQMYLFKLDLIDQY